MIVPMKRLSLIVLTKEKKHALLQLRKAGIVHLDEIAQLNDEIEKLEYQKQTMQRSLAQLVEVRSTTEEGKPHSKVVPQERFDNIHQKVDWLLEQRAHITESLQKDLIERDHVQMWGDFSTTDLKVLEEEGLNLSFYLLPSRAVAHIDQEISFVRLKSIGKQVLIATINATLPDGDGAQKMPDFNRSLSDILSSIEGKEKRLNDMRRELIEYSDYITSYHHYIKVLEQQLRFEKIHDGMGDNETVAWLTGFIPEDEVENMKSIASENSWGYLIEEPDEEDVPPTQIKNKKWIDIIRPVFDILGTVPGYHEYDISMWLLMFFSLFFAMILGDAAYGVIFLIIAVISHKKIGKANNAIILTYVLSIATIIWGSLTGTWFGSKGILEALPFLKLFIIPQIANYPELFNVSTTSAQNAVMKFTFIIGTLQLSLASVMNMYRKISRKDISAVADFGWLIMIDALYFIVLMLVINASANVPVVSTVIGIGFLLIIIFGAQGPGVPFGKGVLTGLGNIFSTFLDTISAFSNIISYIRLFAVGMASLAIAQSFNSLGSSLLSGIAIPAGILVLVIGHGLNLIMAVLSVVVHGVRLNLLEFSGQLGMEWTGITYDPFRETVET